MADEPFISPAPPRGAAYIRTHTAALTATAMTLDQNGQPLGKEHVTVRANDEGLTANQRLQIVEAVTRIFRMTGRIV